MRLPVLLLAAMILLVPGCRPAVPGSAQPQPPSLQPPSPLVVSFPSELQGVATALRQAWADAGLEVHLRQEQQPGPPAHLALAVGAGETVTWETGVPAIPFLSPDAAQPTPVLLADLRWRHTPTQPPQPVGLRPTGISHPQAEPATALARRHFRPRPARPVTLAVAGDFMLARGVGARIHALGPAYPVELVAERLRTADLTIANLESPIGRAGQPLPGKGIWFRADPAATETLTLAGLDLVTLANNHILDYDTENFLETLGHLNQAGVRYVGGGRTLAEARQPAVLEAAGLRVAFLSYSLFADLYFDPHYPRRFTATDTVPGVAPVRDADLLEDIAHARRVADVVAVAFHWGEEYQNHPNAEQIRLAHLSADAGADLVLGFHPHAVQGFEIYKNTFIAYSFGNFIMDDESLGTIQRESFLAEFTFFPGGGRSARIIPAYITGFRPAFLSGPAADRFLTRLARLSAEIPHQP